ncbi:MAG: acyl-CoA thioesterase-1 [Gammaproteobacteria bacterium]|jgi:acyl-CoA thioesterase-1
MHFEHCVTISSARLFKGKAKLILRVFILAMLLSGCTPDGPKLSPLSREATILAFGDSLTRGTGSGPEQDYPTVLGSLTGYNVVNAGVPGEVSSAGLKRLEGILESVQPQLVILCHGGNDLLRKQNVGQTTENIMAMIELARAHGAEVFLIGVPRPGLLLGTAKFYFDIAEQSNVPLDAKILSKILSDPALKSDPVHPNAMGYAKLAQEIFKSLKQLGAL